MSDGSRSGRVVKTFPERARRRPERDRPIGPGDYMAGRIRDAIKALHIPLDPDQALADLQRGMGRWISEARSRASYTIEDVACAVGVPDRLVESVECGTAFRMYRYVYFAAFLGYRFVATLVPFDADLLGSKLPDLKRLAQTRPRSKTGWIAWARYDAEQHRKARKAAWRAQWSRQPQTRDDYIKDFVWRFLRNFAYHPSASDVDSAVSAVSAALSGFGGKARLPSYSNMMPGDEGSTVAGADPDTTAG